MNELQQDVLRVRAEMLEESKAKLETAVDSFQYHNKHSSSEDQWYAQNEVIQRQIACNKLVEELTTYCVIASGPYRSLDVPFEVRPHPESGMVRLLLYGGSFRQDKLMVGKKEDLIFIPCSVLPSIQIAGKAVGCSINDKVRHVSKDIWPRWIIEPYELETERGGYKPVRYFARDLIRKLLAPHNRPWTYDTSRNPWWDQ